MFKELSGARGLVFLTIKEACGLKNDWAEISYQDISDASGCARLDYTRYAIRVLLNANVIQKRKSATSRKNEWRINPDIEAALEQLMKVQQKGNTNAK